MISKQAGTVLERAVLKEKPYRGVGGEGRDRVRWRVGPDEEKRLNGLLDESSPRKASLANQSDEGSDSRLTLADPHLISYYAFLVLSAFVKV